MMEVFNKYLWEEGNQKSGNGLKNMAIGALSFFFLKENIQQYLLVADITIRKGRTDL